MDRNGNPHVAAFLPTNDVTVVDVKRHLALAKYSGTGDFQWLRPFRSGDFDFSNVVSVAGSGVRLTERRAAKPDTGRLPPLTREAKLAAVNTGDNPNSKTTPMRAAAGAQAPVLQLRKSGDHLVLFWSRDFTNFVLEATDTLTPFPIWETVPVKAELIGDQVAVTVSIDRAMNFYRLCKP